MTRQTAVVVCPGRGVYGAPELGYLARHHGGPNPFLDAIDAAREAAGRPGVRALDADARYSPSRHAASEHASALIYACALADFAAIDRERFDIVAVCGNSLGWYLTLAAAGAVTPATAIAIVDGMGARMAADGVGGQLVYPVCDEAWRPDPDRLAHVEAALATARRSGEAHWSIRLGGMAVLAGDEPGLAALEAALEPADGRFPFRLVRHAAFHTPLLSHVSEAALAAYEPAAFSAPDIPMIDGRGAVWSPLSARREALQAYTFGPQIVEPYDFSASVRTALREFAPDRLIVLGPGSSLGPPIAQTVIAEAWWGLNDKSAFQARQEADPVILAMGREDQRSQVTG